MGSHSPVQCGALSDKECSGLSYDDAWNAFFFWKAKIIYIRIDKVPDRANLDSGMHVFPFHYDDLL